MEHPQKAGMSPVSVVGFSCESSELTSPKSGSTAERSSSCSQVSLLSILLSSQHHGVGARGCSSGTTAEDCYDDEEEEDYDVDDEEADRGGSASGFMPVVGNLDITPAPLRRAKTAPMEVPTAIYLRDPLAKTQLQQMHYERVRRREQLEAMHQQAMRAACQQPQQQHGHHHHASAAAAH